MNQFLNQFLNLYLNGVFINIFEFVGVFVASHGGQGGAEGYQANKLNNLASGLAAFATDLGAKLSDVVVLVMTEFGRTARENGSGGTDHGHAGAWYLLGGNVTGGVHGSWPGLEDHQLHQGRYLAHSIDFRDVLAEVTRHHLGNSRVDEVLPACRCRGQGCRVGGHPDVRGLPPGLPQVHGDAHHEAQL